VDGSGNLYAVWQDHRDGEQQIYFAYQPAGGSWGASEPISPTTQAQDRLSLAVNRRGEAVVSWRQGTYPTYDVFCAIRPAGGEWGAAEQRAGPDGGILNTDVARDDWGRVYLAWRRGSQIVFAERSLEGSWSADEQIRDTSTGSTWGIQIAVDGAGNVHAVWEDYRSGPGISEIYAAYRPAGGPWSVNVRIDEGSGNMWSPGLGIDGAGNAVAAWSEMNTDVYGAVRYLGSGWTPSELLVTAPALSSRALADERRTSPLGPQAVQSWMAGLSLAGPAGAIFSVGASILGPLNILTQDLGSPGSNGCGNVSAVAAMAGQALTPHAPAQFSADSCRGGNGGQDPALNGDDGFIGPPGPPEGYQEGGWHVETRIVDGQEIYVVDTPGVDGVYDNIGDAQNFAQNYVHVPSSEPTLDLSDLPPAPPTDIPSDQPPTDLPGDQGAYDT
jgi:hypothetical protein